MGCCVSKCKPKTKPHLNLNVQDKLVILQTPPPSSSSPPPRNPKTVQSPPLSLSLSLSSSSFTCSTQTSSCGSSSLSSASSASSVAFSKVDRSFSNDFLQSCARENPQIIASRPINNNILEVKQLVPRNAQKRARATSPTLTRQKSFRQAANGRSSAMRSPSPSRRFTSCNYQRPPMVFSSNTHSECKQLIRSSPNRKPINKERPMHLKRSFGYEMGAKVDGRVAVGQVLSEVNYSAPVATEDIDNPHIALDCFIFL